MRSLRITTAVWVGILSLLACGTRQADAGPILGVIDIGPILERHPGPGNSLGLAYNPTSDVLYLSQFVTPPTPPFLEGYIYTIDLQGNLLNEFDFHNVYRPESVPESLSYDRSTGHLFVLAFVLGEGVGRIVEMSPDGSTIFRELTVPLGGGGGIVTREDGIWQTAFASDIIRHYTRDGLFIEDVSVAGSFPGFPGPSDIASSFTGGFFLVDHFGRRVVEVDIGGNQIAAASTASLGGLGSGRGLAIASDINTQRMFLQVDNSEIYTLSSEFISVIPEPSSLELSGIGTLGLIGYLLRYRKHKAEKYRSSRYT